MRAVEPPDGSVQVVEGQVGHLRGDLGADAKRPKGLVDDQQPAGFVNRREDRVDVQRRDRARIDHFDRDTFAGQLLGGLAVIETVFNLPGFGRLLIEAIFARDYPVIQGCLLFTALFFVVINLIVDLLYPRFDPRVTVE